MDPSLVETNIIESCSIYEFHPQSNLKRYAINLFPNEFYPLWEIINILKCEMVRGRMVAAINQFVIVFNQQFRLCFQAKGLHISNLRRVVLGQLVRVRRVTDPQEDCPPHIRVQLSQPNIYIDNLVRSPEEFSLRQLHQNIYTPSRDFLRLILRLTRSIDSNLWNTTPRGPFSISQLVIYLENYLNLYSEKEEDLYIFNDIVLERTFRCKGCSEAQILGLVITQLRHVRPLSIEIPQTTREEREE